MEKVEVISTINKIESGAKGAVGSLNIRNFNVKAGSDITIEVPASASNLVLFPVSLKGALLMFLKANFPLDFEFQLFVESTTTGTIAVTNGSKEIDGSSTLFNTELAADDLIVVDPVGLREVLLVASVTDDTNATMVYNVQRQTGSGLDYLIYKADATWHKMATKQLVGDGLFISGMRVSNPFDVPVSLKLFMAGL